MKTLIKRVYEPVAATDGQRILVDRLWPRGLVKTKIDLWFKEVVPSNELRKWFGHAPEKWAGFQKKYQQELKDNPALKQLRTAAKRGKVTLLFAAKNEAFNNAVALQKILSQDPD